ncbi:MAG: hypothetical protein WBR26_03270 [Candidatus Acidiferrum sp.]
MNSFERGVMAPADGNAASTRNGEPFGAGAPFADSGLAAKTVDGNAAVINIDELGPNLERLEDIRPELVNALRELVRQYRMEGVAARRHEIRRIRQARLFWQGLQYAWWNANDMNWHLPYENPTSDDSELEEMPRYQFVTNFYQGFGLSFVAVLSQDVPSVRFYPQSFQSLVDIAAARAASDVAELIERNNHVEDLLTAIGYFLWTDGKLGAYVRYVEDAQRFGFRDEEILQAVEVPLGPDVWKCPECGKTGQVESGGEPGDERQDAGNEEGFLASQTPLGMTDGEIRAAGTCPECGAELGEKDLKKAERVMVPRVCGVRRLANGQEVISIAGGLELNTPVWANEMREFPYLQWQAEVHRAKLKAAYPHVADRIESTPAMDEIDAAFYRGDAAARTQLAQRMMQQDPAAFREMVEAGAKLLGLGVQRSSAHSATQENNLHAEAQRAAESQGTAADNPPEQVVRAYREFESAANAELEKSVGTAITRVMEQALPNLRVTGARGREDAQETAPLQERLTVAVREEVEKALQSDRQLGEQVVRVLAGRRFDNAARAQVVRLIDARAQQLVPSAVKRVVGSWTQATLGSPAKREPVTKTVVANNTPRAQTRAEKTPPRNESATGRREITSRSRRVDYGRLSDEEILGM